MLARQGIQALFYDDETPQEIRRPQRRALISGSCVEVKWMRSLDGLLFGKGMVGNGMGNPEGWFSFLRELKTETTHGTQESMTV